MPRTTFRCPVCHTELVVASTYDVTRCVTCGRTLQEHDETYGHHRWCEFPGGASTAESGPRA